VADVAVLRSFASVEFNPPAAWPPRSWRADPDPDKIPFEIILDRQLEELSSYKAVVLARAGSPERRAGERDPGVCAWRRRPGGGWRSGHHG